ncbi:rhomboid family intramembrane serine protease [Allostreptomyces psammosilenae]|uniref:Membrane associated rhomboid family serine protease n=1 Tax=Allostreptomyces psammosilenae TaxID=1892865 RepID=A0A852ZU25_9ACTN|nr:rhomboid family intramembrane serine protease [Allostreptomyces psammosilenae]NYI05385.1 membrane associated rhomboid family serine protease [Allostreptomyces psammosilenae]
MAPDQQPADSGARPPVATCYRHPDRETGVRCTRCDKPVCPDCMVSAAVGFQCPDCVREANRTFRPTRTEYGGRTSGDPALVTKILIGLNLAVFLFGQIAGDGFYATFLMVGRAYYGGDSLVGLAEGPDQWYRLLTAAFLHQAIWHLAVNMMSLWFLGPYLESLLGRTRFLGLYLLAALGGSAASFLFAPHPSTASLGASGAIFGLFGAIFVVHRSKGYDLRSLVVILAINLVIGFLPGSAIDWRAHLGGLVTGALVAAGMVYAPRGPRRALVQAGVCVVALALVLGAVLLGTNLLASSPLGA